MIARRPYVLQFPVEDNYPVFQFRGVKWQRRATIIWVYPLGRVFGVRFEGPWAEISDLLLSAEFRYPREDEPTFASIDDAVTAAAWAAGRAQEVNPRNNRKGVNDAGRIRNGALSPWAGS